MDSDYGLDLDDLARAIDESEVLVVRFQIIPDRLLIDVRPDEGSPPRIDLVPPVESPEERYRYLEQSRPGVPLPEQITVVAWPRHIDVMRRAGLWGRVVERLIDAGGESLRGRCDEVFREIAHAERRELTAAIRGGEGYESLWERRPGR